MAGILFSVEKEKQKEKDELTQTKIFDRVNVENKEEKSRVQMIFMLDPYEIEPNPMQPRKFFKDEAIISLSDSIRLHGIIQPLCVRKKSMGNYELVSGERRLRAAKHLGLSAVPCVLVNADSKESAQMAIIENIQRENLNMFEEARAIGTLIKVHCLTQEKIARSLSCSQSYVANKLRLLKLPDEDKEEILASSLTERHVRALLRIKDEKRRRAAMHVIINREMNVASTEEYIDNLLDAEQKALSSEKNKNIRLFLKDVKILYNTIDRAVETVRQSGINVETVKTENSNDTQITIIVPKNCSAG